MVFRDRTDAGRKLGEELRGRVGEDAVVLGVARGGVVVAAGVASVLGADLDVVISHKIGAPGNPEFAIGAISPGIRVLDESLLARLGVHKGYLDDEITTQEAEIERRSEAYRGGRPQAILAGRPVIVVDDGIATGATAMAAIRWVRAQQPDSITFAAPVSSVAALALVGAEADDALSLVAPSSFQAVGHWYREFDQVTDEQVIRALETARVH